MTKLLTIVHCACLSNVYFDKQTSVDVDGRLRGCVWCGTRIGDNVFD